MRVDKESNRTTLKQQNYLKKLVMENMLKVVII